MGGGVPFSRHSSPDPLQTNFLALSVTLARPKYADMRRPLLEKESPSYTDEATAQTLRGPH